MSDKEGSGHEQQSTDSDGNWDSKSETSSPSSSTPSSNNDQPVQPVQPVQPCSRLDPELENYLMQYKAELDIETIKTFHKFIKILTQTAPNRNLNEYIDGILESKRLAEQELELSRKEVEKARTISKLLNDQLKEEYSRFDKIRIDKIVKNSGCAQYFESKDEVIKIKEATIERELTRIRDLERDNDNLRDRLTRANKLIDEHRKLLRQALAQPKPHDFDMNRRRNFSQHGGVSMESPEPHFDSLNDYSIPRPPSVEAEEILRLVNSPPDPNEAPENSSIYNGMNFFNSSIPPPPDVEVSLDEILSDVNSANFSVDQNLTGQ